MTVALFGPNTKKLAAAKDIDALRAALHHPRRYIRVNAARALSDLALPWNASERREIVPQEAVADLLAVMRSIESEPAAEVADGSGMRGAIRKFRRESREVDTWYVVVAVAKVGGPAAVQAVVELAFEWRDEQRQSRVPSLLALLGADVAIQMVRDGSRPRWLRDLAWKALEGESAPGWGPADEERAARAAREYVTKRRIEDRQAKESAKRASWERQKRAKTAAHKAKQERQRRLREFESSTEVSLSEAVALLIELYDATPRGEGFLVGTPSSEPVGMVGRRLYESGGFARMLEAHQLFAEQRPRAARNLEMLWDGVGTWQG